jgi:serine/threonine protein kinase/tetratricopeptide (TPR) repeat protein
VALARESSNTEDSEFAPWETVRTTRAWSHCAWRTEPGPLLATQRCCSSSYQQPEHANFGRERPASSEITAAWERNSSTLVDIFLDGLNPSDSRETVELIYREFCLLDAVGQKRDKSEYLRRFARYAEALERLLGLHDACSPSFLARCTPSSPGNGNLPSAGCSIGPYFLRRELGRGSFARVFLAEQVNLENRLVVVKVATHLTREPWLLARVRHPQVVEVVAHALVEDCGFHLICMPFLGGATLAAVLAENRRRWPVASGAHLLTNLDAVAAPEFPVSGAVRPAHEIMAALSFDQAVAWIGARLAEALDYAFTKNVAHGDVKPSNILLTADGSPMLLDFNLARDGSPFGTIDHVDDPGGTAPYMAPERLCAMSSSASVLADLTVSGKRTKSSASLPFSERGSLDGETLAGVRAHQADIYSLGMVLLEALTCRTPTESSVEPTLSPSPPWSKLESATKMFAKAQVHSARLRLNEAEGASGRTIPAGFRAILEHALDPTPSYRYQRARDLAEDLDRWCSNRPLAFAAEPLWRYTIPSWIRRRKRFLLVAAAALPLVLVLSITTLMILSGRTPQEDLARDNLTRHWDGAEAYRVRPLTSEWMEDPFRGSASFRLIDPGDPRALELARDALEDFGVLGPGDWRRNESFSHLRGAEREDLELWLMEQAYRYCLALAERPDSRHDWERARSLLDRLAEAYPLSVFTTLCASLDSKLDPAGPTVSRSQGFVIHSDPRFSPRAQAAPTWVSEYILGVAAECEFELSENQPIQLRDNLVNLDSAPIRPTVRGRASSARALEHYRKLLATRPESYWGNYRAAGVCYVLGAFAESAQYLARCLVVRPNNAAVRGQRAKCFAWLERYSEALKECDQALDRAPDLPELYRTRAFIRASSGQTSGLAADIEHFEALRRLLPLQFPENVPRTEQSDPEVEPTAMLDRLTEFSGGFGFHATVEARPWFSLRGGQISAVDPGECSIRLVLASKIRDAGDRELASSEYAKILMLDPDHVPTRTFRALDAIEDKRFGQAQYDLQLVLNHPHLTEYLRRNPTFLRSLIQASRRFSLNGRVQEGQAQARRALAYANEVHQLRSESHYNLARAYAISAHDDPRFVSLAANELWWVLLAHPDYEHYYFQDSTFDSVRDQIDRELRLKPDPRDEYRRRVAARLAHAK